jgi:hypothetical protein
LSGLLDREYHHGQRDERRHDRDPEHEAEIAGAKRHEGNGGERPDNSADRIERLSQAEARAPQVYCRNIGNQRITRGAADAPSRCDQ